MSEPHHQTITATEARQGVTLGVMRYVLGVSLVLAVLVMIAAYLLITH